MIKNKSLFKNISIFFCLVPMLFLSLFCLIPNKNKMDVSALGDQVITNFNFVGSNVFVPLSLVSSSGNFFAQRFANLTLSFGVLDGVYRAAVSGVYHTADFTAVSQIQGVLTRVPNLESATSSSVSLDAYLDGGSSYLSKIRVFHSGQLSSDIIKVVYSSFENVNPNIIQPANFYNTITYYDSQGEFIEFRFPLYSRSQTFASQFLFEERVYYFTNSFDDNDFYNLGYQDGLETGLQDGYQNGYQSGLDVGSQSGYQDGFSDGVQSANDYSFMGLLGAVIDTPVTALTGLLNFEILGFNILSFVTGLITLALIIFIVKLCIGGK